MIKLLRSVTAAGSRSVETNGVRHHLRTVQVRSGARSPLFFSLPASEAFTFVVTLSVRCAVHIFTIHSVKVTFFLSLFLALWLTSLPQSRADLVQRKVERRAEDSSARLNTVPFSPDAESKQGYLLVKGKRRWVAIRDGMMYISKNWRVRLALMSSSLSLTVCECITYVLLFSSFTHFSRCLFV